ncbi:MAG: alpha-mannosidase [Tannerellaceae bacterium]|nr:alpha-mannosidase [Tannerellaceae bacterium]
MKAKYIFIYLFLGLCAPVLRAQSVYFVDGYHGGIYGHYPLWNTQFYVDKLAEYPEWQICLEIEPETWDVAREKTPAAYRAFQKIASGPRVEFTNPTIAQPYMYNISGESIIRQFEHGIDWIRSHFPGVTFTTYSVEEPCFTSCLPQILKSFGFKYAVLKCPNTCWGGYTTAYGGELVNWIGPDGTPILTVPRYACEALGKDVWYTTAADNSDEYLAAARAAGIKHPVGMCFQDAGWNNGPWLGTGNNIKNNSIYLTWRNYIEQVSKGKTDDNWHFTQEDVLPGLMWGSQVLQQLAREVRQSENNLITAEKINAMRYMQRNQPVDEALFRNAWRTLAMSQHHDSWIVPYNGLTPGKTWAQMITEWTANTDRIATNIIFPASAGNQEEVPNTIRLTNTTSTPREEWTEISLPIAYSWANLLLTDEKGKPVPTYKSVKEGKTSLQFMAKTPAFGYAVYKIKKENTPAGHASVPTVCKAGYNKDYHFVMENDFYRITFDLAQGGTIRSLEAKKMGNKEFVDTTSIYRFGELRGYFYDEQQFRSNTETRASVTVIEQTPGKVTVEIKNEIAGHLYTNRITLRQGDPKIDGTLLIDWKGNPGIGEFHTQDTWNVSRRPFYDDRYKLHLLFPAATGEQQVYKNAPFDVCRSRLKNTFYPSWDSIKHNIVLNWVDFAGKDTPYGLALFTDHTTSYLHGSDYPAGLTIQYSGMGLWGRDYPITGPTQLKYALLPHTGLWDEAHLWTGSVQWNEPIRVETYYSEQAESGRSLVNLDKSGYEITTVEVKNGALYLRLFNAESDGEPVKLNFGFTPVKIEEIELNGEVINTLPLQEQTGILSTEIAMPRFGLRTLKISI